MVDALIQLSPLEGSTLSQRICNTVISKILVQQLILIDTTDWVAIHFFTLGWKETLFLKRCVLQNCAQNLKHQSADIGIK